MISKELEKKVDETVASTIVNQEINQPATDLVADPGVPNSTDQALVEQLETPVDPLQDPPSIVEAPDEPIQVAGLGSLVTKLKEATKAAESRVLPPLPDRPVIQLSEGLLVYLIDFPLTLCLYLCPDLCLDLLGFWVLYLSLDDLYLPIRLDLSLDLNLFLDVDLTWDIDLFLDVDLCGRLVRRP